MKLDDDFTLEGIDYEWTLKKHKVTKEINEKTGNPVVKSGKWHYPTITMALKKYTDESLKDLSDIKEVMSKQDEILDMISNLKCK